MGFKKGNTLGRLGTIAREEHKENVWEFITSGGLRKSVKLLEDMLENGSVTKTQQDGIEMLLKFMPYCQAKKMPVNSDGETKMEIQITTV